MQIRKKSNSLENLLIISLGLIPWGLISGAFVAEFFFNLSTVIGLFFLKKKKIKFDKFFLIILFIFWFYLVFTNLYHFYYSDVQPKIISSLGYIRFILFFLVIREIFYLINFKKIIFLQGLSVILISIDVIFQKVFGFNLIGIMAQENRYSSFFGEEYISGSFISKMFFPILILFSYFPKKNNYIFIILISLFFLSTFFSGERMATLTVLIIFFLTALLYKDKRLLISIFLILSIISLPYMSKSGRFNEIVSIFSISDKKINEQIKFNNKFINLLDQSGHLPLFVTSYKIWKENSVFGSGLKTFRQKCSDKKFDLQKYKYSNCSTHPHNYYLEILSETGILGFLMIFFIIFSIFYKSIKILSRKIYNEDFLLLKCFLVLNLSFLIIISSGSFYNNWISIIFWLNITFLSSLNKKFLN